MATSRDVDSPYLECQVEKPAVAAPGNRAPEYPPSLGQEGVSGEVLLQFVVDTMGRAEMGTVRVLRADHMLFEVAARRALFGYKFRPAETAGRKVRQMVQLPFVFNVFELREGRPRGQ